MANRPTFTRFSSEFDEPRTYYADTGEEVPVKPLEANVGEYKPEYDFETRSIKHWWFRNESELFFDVHTKIATFRSRNMLGKYWKAFRIVWMHKHVWRHL